MPGAKTVWYAAFFLPVSGAESAPAGGITMSKILIVHPDFERLGGIESYLLKVRPHFRRPCVFCPIARRPGESGPLRRSLRILSDYRRFWKALGDRDVEIVHLNPSLEPKSFFREAVFLMLARLRRRKTLVFFHGWRRSFQRRLDGAGGRTFRLLYGRAHAFVVLARDFADALRAWGVTQPVHIENTVISDSAVAGFDLESALETRINSPTWRLIFASRLMRSKGLGTAIEALHEIQRTNPGFELVVAGSGEFAAGARALVERLGVHRVSFLDELTEQEVYEQLRLAHILCFPTEHDEGFPNTVVEAMSFGLPVVTRPVGGIPDFFQPGVHGFMTESTSPADFARLVLNVAGDHERYRTMSRANHAYAREHFLASQAAARLEDIYATLDPPAPGHDQAAISM